MSEKNVALIIDLEIKWKASNFIWLIEITKKAKKKHQIRINQKKNEKNDENIIIDTVDDSNIRNVLLANDDFVIFENFESDENVQLFLKSNKTLIFT